LTTPNLPQQVVSVRYLGVFPLTICCGTLSAHEDIYDVRKEPCFYYCTGRNQMGSTRLTKSSDTINRHNTESCSNKSRRVTPTQKFGETGIDLLYGR